MHRKKIKIVRLKENLSNIVRQYHSTDTCDALKLRNSCDSVTYMMCILYDNRNNYQAVLPESVMAHTNGVTTDNNLMSIFIYRHIILI